jgi:hypothetical protein
VADHVVVARSPLLIEANAVASVYALIIVSARGGVNPPLADK